MPLPRQVVMRDGIVRTGADGRVRIYNPDGRCPECCEPSDPGECPACRVTGTGPGTHAPWLDLPCIGAGVECCVGSRVCVEVDWQCAYTWARTNTEPGYIGWDEDGEWDHHLRAEILVQMLAGACRYTVAYRPGNAAHAINRTRTGTLEADGTPTICAADSGNANLSNPNSNVPLLPYAGMRPSRAHDLATNCVAWDPSSPITTGFDDNYNTQDVLAWWNVRTGNCADGYTRGLIFPSSATQPAAPCSGSSEYRCDPAGTQDTLLATWEWSRVQQCASGSVAMRWERHDVDHNPIDGNVQRTDHVVQFQLSWAVRTLSPGIGSCDGVAGPAAGGCSGCGGGGL